MMTAVGWSLRFCARRRIIIKTARSGPGTGLPAGSYAEAIRDAAARKSAAETLAAVIAMAVESGPCEAAAITMRSAGDIVESVAYSSELILQADELQYELGEGPCLDAVWTNGVFVIPDLSADGRWPAVGTRCRGSWGE